MSGDIKITITSVKCCGTFFIITKKKKKKKNLKEIDTAIVLDTKFPFGFRLAIIVLGYHLP